MIWELFWVGSLSSLVGFVLLILGIGGKVSADTEFGKFSGGVGAVVLVLGLVMMGIAALS
jgi:hypothetical protein